MAFFFSLAVFGHVLAKDVCYRNDLAHIIGCSKISRFEAQGETTWSDQPYVDPRIARCPHKYLSAPKVVSQGKDPY